MRRPLKKCNAKPCRFLRGLICGIKKMYDIYTYMCIYIYIYVSTISICCHVRRFSPCQALGNRHPANDSHYRNVRGSVTFTTESWFRAPNLSPENLAWAWTQIHNLMAFMVFFVSDSNHWLVAFLWNCNFSRFIMFDQSFFCFWESIHLANPQAHMSWFHLGKMRCTRAVYLEVNPWTMSLLGTCCWRATAEIFDWLMGTLMFHRFIV